MVQIGVRPGAEQGSYTVAWGVISADTHPVSGAFTFSVGHPSATPAATAAPPGGSTTVGVLYGIIRALAYGSFAALVGAGALMLFCWPAGAARAVAPRVAVGGWAALLMATVGILLLQGPYGIGIGIGDVLEPGAVTTTLELPLGSALLLLVVTAIYLGQLIARLPTAAPKVHAALAVGGVALAIWIAATWSASGHAAVGLQPEIAFPVDVAHLVAMGVWLGGLLVLALALRRPPTEPAEQRELATAVARFSPIASGCVAVLVATGTYQSWRQLGSWPAFLATDYERVLLVKLIAVGALLAAAALSRRAVGRMRSRPAAERQPVGVGVGSSASPTPAPIDSGAADPTLRHTVLGETAVAVVMLGLTAVLVNTEPGRTALAAAATHRRLRHRRTLRHRHPRRPDRPVTNRAQRGGRHGARRPRRPARTRRRAQPPRPAPRPAHADRHPRGTGPLPGRRADPDRRYLAARADRAHLRHQRDHRRATHHHPVNRRAGIGAPIRPGCRRRTSHGSTIRSSSRGRPARREEPQPGRRTVRCGVKVRAADPE